MTRIVTFGGPHLEGAAVLLHERHERHRGHLPILGPVRAPKVLRSAWSASSGGLAAVTDAGRVCGYLLWRVQDSHLRGRHAWVGRADHATADAETVRDLYAVAAARWVDAGITRHATVVPATARDLDPWERLAFARMQVHALRPLPAVPGGFDARIRRSGVADVDRDLPGLAPLTWQHQAASPAFTGLDAPSWEEQRAGYLEALGRPGAIHLVLAEDGTPLGHALVRPADDELGWPPRTAALDVVAVVPGHRRRGLGRALTDAAFAEARRAGFAFIEADWRITNLLSSRTWPALGFQPAFHRLWRVTGTG